MAKLLLCICLGVWLHAAQAVTVVDDRQVAVTLKLAPQRIITLLPSLAETVCVLGACSRLVGTDKHANWPASVKALPLSASLPCCLHWQKLFASWVLAVAWWELTNTPTGRPL